MSIKLRHKFYDELLSKILQLPEIKETLKSIKNDDWYKDDYMREDCAIEAYFESNDNMLRVPAIWESVKTDIRSEITYYIDGSPEQFIKRDGWDFKMMDFILEILDKEEEEIHTALQRKHNRDRYGTLKLK